MKITKIHRILEYNQNTVKLDDEQSQQTMTESYANVVQTNLSRNCMPPDVKDPNDDEIDNPNTVVHHLQIITLFSLLFLLYLVFVLQDFWDFVCVKSYKNRLDISK
jgi:hypothetical protein